MIKHKVKSEETLIKAHGSLGLLGKPDLKLYQKGKI